MRLQDCRPPPAITIYTKEVIVLGSNTVSKSDSTSGRKRADRCWPTMLAVVLSWIVFGGASLWAIHWIDDWGTSELMCLLLGILCGRIVRGIASAVRTRSNL